MFKITSLVDSFPLIVGGKKSVSTSAETSPSNIVFIDTRVDNFQSLLSGLKKNTEAVILDPTKDGIGQITEFLKARTGVVDSVQILSHGSAGNLQIGSTQLTSSNLDQYQQSLQQWFSPLFSKRPDLLLYGCDVGSGSLGDDFIQKLSQITGADVAASVDLTGSAAKGGNWVLEKATGVIEAGQAFTRKVRDAYQDVLATTFTVKNTNDSGLDSLRQAITDANNNPGLDTIDFNIAPGGPQTIRPTSDRLPDITDPVFLNGKTQPGFTDTNTPIIEIDGSAFLGSSFPGPAGYSTPPNPGWWYHGLRVVAGGDGSTIQGLVINNFPNSGIKLGTSNGGSSDTFDGPANVIVRDNYIGTDITGTVAKGNGAWGDPNAGSGLYGVRVTGTQFLNNLVSGTWITGVNIRMQDFSSGGARANTISGNYIGTDVTGNFALGNHRWGIYAIAGRTTITGNIVAANGISNEDSSPAASYNIDTRVGNNTVTGNRIGVSASGVALRYRRGIPETLPIDSTAEFSPGGGPNTIGGNILPTAAQPGFVTPTLTTSNPKLSDIPQTAFNNNGNLIKDLAAANITSTPGKGIAITATDNTNGTWEYSTNNGNSWRSIQQAFVFPSGLTQAITDPAPRDVPALYLAADDKNRVRFVPNGTSTTVTNGVTYRAWNQKFGGNGELINVSFTRNNIEIIRQNLSIGAFTNPITDTFGITVTPANVAPTLVPNQVQSTSAFATAIKAPAGVGAGVVIGTALATSVTDPNAGAQKGIAITKLDDTNGTWQYSIADAINFTDKISRSLWIPIPKLTGAVSETSALLLDSNAKLRFVPNAGFTGTPDSATFRAWDQTNGTNGNRVDTTANGGATSVSALDVNILNFAPILAPGTVPTSTNQVNTTDGVLISDFAATAITDGNATNLQGIAITDAPSTDGVWQYSINGGTSWTSIGAVSPTNALLLDIGNKIRFVPNVNEAFSKNISFRAWDQTKGAPGTRLDVVINGGSTSFSTQLATLTINIPINSAKVPQAPIAPPIDPSIFPLLSNPPAPATPAPVIVGGGDPVGLPEVGNPIPVGVNSPNTNAIGVDTDCPCEAVIKQQKSNPVTGVIQGTNKKDYLVGTATANTIYGLKGKDTIVGTPNRDNLFGGKGNDVIFGLGQRDYLRGGAGNDTIYGGRGSDVIFGDKGKDTIYGGRGNDFISGGKGNDTLYGGKGNDFISGGKGSDRLYGGDGNDSLCGCEGNDILWGGKGNDTLSGGKGNDNLYGGKGKDTLKGGDGKDILRGGKGKDILNGGKGKDLLIGGKGDDLLTGGAGRDRFRLAPGAGTDTITDFTVGEDTIELARGLKFSDLQITQGVGATVIGLQPGTLFPSDKPFALLLGVNAGSLTPNSFKVV